MRVNIIVLFFLFPAHLFSQSISKSVIASSGSEDSNDQISVCWTLGESFINEFHLPGYFLSQGFHGTDKNIHSDINPVVKSIDLIYFPNPVNDVLHVQIKDAVSGKSRIQIYDVRGNVLTDIQGDGSLFEIDFSTYMSGTYLVKISNEKNCKVFNIIKSASHEKN